MKNQFVADGPLRHFLGKKGLASEDIGKKYAAELATASPDHQKVINQRWLQELSKRKKMLAHQPSAVSLW
jgi:hypothetical protein